MKRIAFLLGLALFATALPAAPDLFTDSFEVDRADLASIGTNRFFVLAPGFQLVLEGKESKPTVLTITVLNETKQIDGVETRVIEERETVAGKPVEISRNYFAISRQTSDVYYFGEDVDIYREGKVTSHEGGWIAGIRGARFGLAMPGRPLIGARYYQELAPKVAMDRAEIISLSASLATPAGKFDHCLETQETSAIEKGRERKLYAPGIGLISEGGLKLTRFGFKSP
ncbi:MAG TPA: hypothetical protein VN794_20425 [Methylomirabilota bacterium]|nr:hypothetical protein [Methylomirabilota bacterium]